MTVAHGIVGPDLNWTEWTVEFVPLAGLLLVAAVYAVGISRVGGAVTARRMVSFYIGLAVVAVALLSPLDHAATEIFTAHMLQHLLLMLVAPPALVFGRPLVIMAAVLPGAARRRVVRSERTRLSRSLKRATSSALVVLGLNAVVLWAWHLPNLYEAAVKHPWVHGLEHSAFLGSALLFWNVVLGKRSRRHGNIGRSLGLVFGNLLQSGALGAILVFAGSPLYPVHGLGARMWGLTALQDQQLAGALMWIPVGFVYIATMSVLFLRWLRSLDLVEARRSEVVKADA